MALFSDPRIKIGEMAGTFNGKNPVVKFVLLQTAGILLAATLSISLEWLLFFLFISVVLVLIRPGQWILPLVVVILMMVRWQMVQPSFPAGEGGEIRDKMVVEDVQTLRKGYSLLLRSVHVPSLKAKFRLTDDETRILCGDTLIVQGMLTLPPLPSNPGEFNYRQYLYNKGVPYVFSEGEIIQRFDGGFSVSRQFHLARLWVKETVNRHVDPPFSGVMLGLILGDRSGISWSMKNRFQDIGVVHILAVSGLHVGYIFLILTFMATLLRMSPLMSFILILTGLLFYMGLTGFTTSVVRAGLMAILYSLAKYRERSVSGWNIVATAAAISLIINPRQLMMPGFQLSFGAVWGILFVYPRLQKLDTLFPRWKKLRSKKPVRIITDLIFVTIGAQLGTFIPIALYFRFLPVWGILSNLLIVFLAGFTVIAGILMLMVGPFSAFVADLLGNAGWFFIALMNIFSEWIHQLPYKKLPLGGIHPAILTGFLIMGILWIISVKKRYRKITWLYSLVFMNLLLWRGVFYEPPVRVWFLDVGQGDACIIRDGDHTILIDAGFGGFGRDYGMRVILPFLEYEGITGIDLAILSHPHADHIGGFYSVLEGVPVREVWDTQNRYESGLYKRMLRRCEELGIPVVHPQPGGVYRLGRCTFTVIYPDEMLAEKTRNVNDASLVIRVDQGKNSFLFTGDLEFSGESKIRSLSVLQDVDVIKIGHHGSGTSSIPVFCRKVNARYGVISVGRDNKYGHPSQSVIQRWESLGTTLYRTDQSGAVIFNSDGESLQVRTMK